MKEKEGIILRCEERKEEKKKRNASRLLKKKEEEKKETVIWFAIDYDVERWTGQEDLH